MFFKCSTEEKRQDAENICQVMWPSLFINDMFEVQVFNFVTLIRLIKEELFIALITATFNQIN